MKKQGTTTDAKARLPNQPSRIQSLQSWQPSVGGPVLRQCSASGRRRLWSYRAASTSKFVALPRIGRPMPSSRKINFKKVLASLNTVSPNCGKAMSPAEVRRVDFERIECPACRERFAPASGTVP